MARSVLVSPFRLCLGRQGTVFIKENKIRASLRNSTRQKSMVFFIENMFLNASFTLQRKL
jgi:hypothetical protein